MTKVRNFQCPGGILAYAVPMEPASEFTLILAAAETLCTRTIDAGAPAKNVNLTFDAQQAIRRRVAGDADPKLDALDVRRATADALLVAALNKATTPPAPTDAVGAARAAEIRTWFLKLDQTGRNTAIQDAVNTLDPELLSALFHSPVAFNLIAPKTRELVGTAYARATNNDGFEALLVNEQQSAAAKEGLRRAREIVHQVVGWTAADYERAAAQAAARARLIMNSTANEYVV